MGLIGLLHRNVSHSTTETEVYFASNGNRDNLRDLVLYHENRYFHSQGAKASAPNCRFGESDLTLIQGDDVLYTGKQPFVIAEISDAELKHISDANRFSNQSFINDVLTPYITICRLTSRVYEDDSLDDTKRQQIVQQLYKDGTYMGKPLVEYTNLPEVQENVQRSIDGFKQTLKERIAEQIKGTSLEDEFETQYNSKEGYGFDIMKEIQVIGMLLDLKNAKGRNIVEFNDREYPTKLLEIIGMRY